jgi:hypothetical protein
VGPVRCSNHYPIFLKLGQLDGKPGSPFKYNSCWDELEEFKILVNNNYESFRANGVLSTNAQFVSNLQNIKGKASTWARERKITNERVIKTMQDDLEAFYSQIKEGGVRFPIELELYRSLEAKRFNILLEHRKNLETKEKGLVDRGRGS